MNHYYMNYWWLLCESLMIAIGIFDDKWLLLMIDNNCWWRMVMMILMTIFKDDTSMDYFENDMIVDVGDD